MTAAQAARPASARPTELDGITRAQITKFHAGMAATPAAANFHSPTLEDDDLGGRDGPSPRQPAQSLQGHQKISRPQAGTVLERGRVGQVGEALAAAEAGNRESVYAVAAIRLLLLTGARRNEILTLMWREVDAERMVLRLSDSKTGEKIIRLSPAALVVLNAIPRTGATPTSSSATRPAIIWWPSRTPGSAFGRLPASLRYACTICGTRSPAWPWRLALRYR